eukprot:m51a1_g6221 hypothetical protein (335) ;mRNA; f:223902-225363
MARAALYDEVNWPPRELLTADFPENFGVDTRHATTFPFTTAVTTTGLTRLADGSLSAFVAPTFAARGARCTVTVNFAGIRPSKISVSSLHAALPGLRAVADLQGSGARLALDYRSCQTALGSLGASTSLSLPAAAPSSSGEASGKRPAALLALLPRCALGPAEVALAAARGSVHAGAKLTAAPPGKGEAACELTRAEGYVTYIAPSFRLSTYIKDFGKVLGCTYYARPAQGVSVAIDARIDAQQAAGAARSHKGGRELVQSCGAVVEAAVAYALPGAAGCVAKARANTDSRVALSLARRVAPGVRAAAAVNVNAARLSADGGHTFGIRFSLFDE